MTSSPQYPEHRLFEVDRASHTLTDLFACLDASDLHTQYAFGRFDSRSKVQFELYFRSKRDADKAGRLWAKHKPADRMAKTAA